MARSLGTAWIQIKPSLKGISRDVETAMGGSAAAASSNFGNKFKSSFLLAAKQSFSQGFAEFGRRSDVAFSQFKTASIVAITAATAGIVGLAAKLDNASGVTKSFASNLKLVGSSDAVIKATQKQLTDYANKTIYSLSGILTTTGILASAGVKNVVGVSKGLGNMAASAAEPQMALEGLSLQMQQVAGRGFIQTMDWRIMKTWAAGPMVKVEEQLKKINKWDNAQFSSALSEGAISADMLNDAIVKVGKNPVLQDLATKPRTIGAAWASFTETLISNISQSEAWAKIQREGIDLVQSATKWIGENKDTINKWIDSVSTATKDVFNWVRENKELVLIALKAVVAFKALQIATGATRSVLSTLSPYGKILKGTFELAIGGAQNLIGKFKGMGSASKSIDSATGSIGKLNQTAKASPKTFAFGESIASFFKNIGQVLASVTSAVLEPIKALFQGIGEAIAGFFKALSNPQLLIGVLIFTAAAGAVALAILMIGSAISTVTPGLANFLNIVIMPLGTFLLTVFIVALGAVTLAIIRLTQQAVVPLVNAVSGGLTRALNAISGVIRSAGGAISGVVDSISKGIERVLNSIGRLISNVGRQDWYGTGYGITRNFTAGLIDGLIDLMQDSLNKVINAVINIPGIGKALEAVGLKKNPVNISGFKLGRRAMGGPVFGAGGPTSDSIPMALSNGEYVIRAAAARKIGYSNLDQLNSSGEVGGNTTFGDIIIQGYNKDPKELAYEISRIIAVNKSRVMG